jgi:hypothetical protein
VVAQSLQRLGLQVIQPPIAARLAGDQTCGLQHAQVHRDGWAAHRHALGDLPHGEWPGSQAPHDSPPGGMAQSVE